MVEDSITADHWLARASHLVLEAVSRAKSADSFVTRWSSIASKLEKIPPCLSDLSSHPFFSKSTLCKEQLQSISGTVSEAIELADRSSFAASKLHMQSEIDALSARLDLCIHDCRLLIKSGVLGESDHPGRQQNAEDSWQRDVRELLARIQIGPTEAKQRAVEGLLEALRADEKSVVASLRRSNVSSLVQLLTSSAAPKVREKAVTVICLLAESGNCESLLISEGVLPPLIRLLESGSSAGREKAVASLQRLSMSTETARSIAGHGAIGPLIEACQAGDSISHLAAVGTLKNLSAVPEVRQGLVDEGTVRAMVVILDSAVAPGLKEHAAVCLRNLTSSSENLRRAVVTEGGIRSLLGYLDEPLPREPAVVAIRNLVDSVSIESLIFLGLLPRLVRVLDDGSLEAREAAASAICKISNSSETKRLVGEFGCLPPLLNLLEAKSDGAREVAVRAIASLMACRRNRREVRKEERSVPNLVQLLDPSPQNTAKYAVSCLLVLASSRKCRMRMISYGAIGYLKKLTEMDVPGGKKLLGRLESGGLMSLFSKN